MLIHCEPRIAWQGPFAQLMATGLAVLGIDSEITNSRERLSDIAIVLGTTLWRQVENSGRYLLVDRCSIGNTNQFVSLVWDGHGRRGDHCVPDNYDASRWRAHGIELMPWRSGDRVVLCGQVETYSPRWLSLDGWYASHSEATHFRPHPQGSRWRLPSVDTFTDAGIVVTLNSSVAIESLIVGRHTVVDDEGGMAFGWTDRWELMCWLAWTQWSHREIENGIPISHVLAQIDA